jgi:hypothetical protein
VAHHLGADLDQLLRRLVNDHGSAVLGIASVRMNVEIGGRCDRGLTTAEVRLDQGKAAWFSAARRATREFSCSAPQRDGKLPSTVRESGECRLGARDATYERRLLRVGIPFGESLADRYADNAADLARGNRGLLFLAIQASIEGKFKFLQARWANDPSRPKMPGGNDMIGRMLPCATG